LETKVLSRGKKSLSIQKRLKTMASPKNYVTPSHVLYANDLMVFCKANANNIKSLFSFFKDYEAISG